MSLMPTEQRLRRKFASDYLQQQYGIIRKPSTLAKLAVIGGGPKFQYDGRFPLYPISELDAWASKQLHPVISSTSEKTTVARTFCHSSKNTSTDDSGVASCGGNNA